MKLNPCPFCGNSDVLVRRPGTSKQSSIIFCENCGATLESNESTPETGTFWNNRPGEKAAQVEVMEAARQTVFKHSPTPAGIEWMELAAHKIDKLIEATK